MNYIHSLRAANDSKAAELAALRQGLRDLLAHIALPKFHAVGDQWISTADVARMVHAIESAATDAANT